MPDPVEPDEKAGWKSPDSTGITIPLRLHCPECHELHLDVGEFATKPHHTHACQNCGNVWRPAIVNTVGVRFLPGFRNETEPVSYRAGDTVHINQDGFEADATILQTATIRTGPFPRARWHVRYDNGNEDWLFVSGRRAELTVGTEKDGTE